MTDSTAIIPGVSVRPEIMAPHFAKLHLDGLPFPAVLHRFTEVDMGDPHDHPWGFTSHILSGGYVEEVFTETAGGRWGSTVYTRYPGTSHRVDARHIHRIIGLPFGECWTLIQPGPWEHKSRFWRFGETIESRAWDEVEWTAFDVARKVGL